MLQELIREHPELRIREDSELFEDTKGKLYVKAKNGSLTEVIVKENEPAITRTVTEEIKGLRSVRVINTNERSD